MESSVHWSERFPQQIALRERLVVVHVALWQRRCRKGFTPNNFKTVIEEFADTVRFLCKTEMDILADIVSANDSQGDSVFLELRMRFERTSPRYVKECKRSQRPPEDNDDEDSKENE